MILDPLNRKEVIATAHLAKRRNPLRWVPKNAHSLFRARENNAKDLFLPALRIRRLAIGMSGVLITAAVEMVRKNSVFSIR